VIDYRSLMLPVCTLRAALVACTLVPSLLHAEPTSYTDPAMTSRASLEEITVTARKKDETALTVPVSITALTEADFEKLGIKSFTDYATKVPNLSFSYGTGNLGYIDSRTVAIRGIEGSGTTGTYIDETPIPGSLDPRLLDIQRIEILKGPQGTLFGQGSLGGTVRLITVQPTPGEDDVHYTASFGGTSGAGSPDFGVSFAASHTVTDNLVLRAVGFFDHEGGYLHRLAVDPNTGETLANVNNYGAEKSHGGSLALRWIAADRVDVGLRIMAQEQNWDGWAAPYAPNPPFEVQSLTLNRTNNIQEVARDRFYLPALTIEYRGGGYTLHESLSYFDRRATQIEDGSEGTRDALAALWAAADPGILGVYADNQGFAWSEIVSQRETVSETRLSFDKTSFGFSGVAGVYLSRSFSDTQFDSGSIPLIQQLGLNTNAAVGIIPGVGGYCRNPNNYNDTSCPSYGSGLGWFSYEPAYTKNQALFGELYYNFAQFELTLGGRYYHQTQNGQELLEGALNLAYLNFSLPQTEQSGFDPKLAIKYQIDPMAMVYASYSKGFRSGGAGVPLPVGPPSFFSAIHQTPGTPTTYTSDTVDNYEFGGKIAEFDNKVILTGAVFQMNWNNIQQAIIAPVSYISLIVNAGDARVRGGEFALEAKPNSYVDLQAGVGYEDAVITHGVLYWQPTGSRVYQVPDVTANASVTFTIPVNDRLSSFLTIDSSYTGSSVSGTMGCQLNAGPGVIPEYPKGVQFFPCPSVSPTNPAGYAPTRAGYSVLNARIGLDWAKSQLALYANNLTNARPNLGDINPESYAKHSMDSADFDPVFGAGYIVPRVATLRPFSVGLEFSQRF